MILMSTKSSTEILKTIHGFSSEIPRKKRQKPDKYKAEVTPLPPILCRNVPIPTRDTTEL